MSDLLLKSAYEGDAPVKEAFADVCVIVVGHDNHCWGKGATLSEAKKLARNPRKWTAYVAMLDTQVSEFDAALTWERGFAPRIIATQGLRKK